MFTQGVPLTAQLGKEEKYYFQIPAENNLQEGVHLLLAKTSVTLSVTVCYLSLQEIGRSTKDQAVPF